MVKKLTAWNGELLVKFRKFILHKKDFLNEVFNDTIFCPEKKPRIYYGFFREMGEILKYDKERCRSYFQKHWYDVYVTILGRSPEKYVRYYTHRKSFKKFIKKGKESFQQKMKRLSKRNVKISVQKIKNSAEFGSKNSELDNLTLPNTSKQLVKSDNNYISNCKHHHNEFSEESVNLNLKHNNQILNESFNLNISKDGVKILPGLRYDMIHSNMFSTGGPSFSVNNDQIFIENSNSIEGQEKNCRKFEERNKIYRSEFANMMNRDHHNSHLDLNDFEMLCPCCEDDNNNENNLDSFPTQITTSLNNTEINDLNYEQKNSFLSKPNAAFDRTKKVNWNSFQPLGRCFCPLCMSSNDYSILESLFNIYIKQISINDEIFESILKVRFCKSCFKPDLRNLNQISNKEESLVRHQWTPSPSLILDVPKQKNVANNRLLELKSEEGNIFVDQNSNGSVQSEDFPNCFSISEKSENGLDNKFIFKYSEIETLNKNTMFQLNDLNSEFHSKKERCSEYEYSESQTKKISARESIPILNPIDQDEKRTRINSKEYYNFVILDKSTLKLIKKSYRSIAQRSRSQQL